MKSRAYFASTAPNNTKTEKEVLAAVDAWKQAMLKKGRTGLEKVLHADVSYGHSSGLIEKQGSGCRARHYQQGGLRGDGAVAICTHGVHIKISHVHGTQLMKGKLPVLTLLLALGLTTGDWGKTESGSSGSGGSGKNVRSGAAHFERLCAGCHGSDGLALEGEAPPLAGASWVAGPETRLIRIVMHGVRGPIQVGNKIYDREMPGVGPKLSDQEMASLLSFVRSRWGAPSGLIAPETVRRVRAAARHRTRYWTVEELLAAP